MKKIPSLFVRDWGTKLVTEAVTPGCEWVGEGGGVASRKYDGTACKFAGVPGLGVWYKRREFKVGSPEPVGFVHEQTDDVTGKVFGWVPVGLGAEDTYHQKAIAVKFAWHGVVMPRLIPFTTGATYELVGPKVQGNPDGFPVNVMVEHGKDFLLDCPRDYVGVKAYLEARPTWEGVVWRHEDGRMAKCKYVDFFGKRKSD